MELKKLNKDLLTAIKNKDFEKIKVLHFDIKTLKKKLEEDNWKTMKPFENIYNIPQLPKPLSDFHIKRLIECGAIPKKDLEIGAYYLGRNRNTKIAQWDGNEFIFLREMKYIEKCFHFEDDNGFALFTPLKKIGI